VYPAPFTFVLSLLVQDSGSPRMNASTSVNVTVTNILPRPPPASANTFVLMANATTGVTAGTVAAWSAYPGHALSYQVTGQDTVTAGSSDMPFAMDPVGVVTVANLSDRFGNSYSPAFSYNARSAFNINYTVIDQATGKSAPGVARVLLAHVNRAPVWTPVIPRAYARTLTPGSVGVALLAYVTDADVGVVAEAFTFTITGGNTDTTFAIRANDGQLSVADPNAPSFNYPAGAPYPPTYNLTVRVCDSGIDGPVLRW
jgi:hypothetical protein